MNTKWVTIAVIAILSFFIGRYSKKTKEEVVYKKEQAVAGEAIISLPKKETTPVTPTLPFKYIFINNTEYQAVDTAKIIEEYAKEKTYDVLLFDNEYGKLTLEPTLQYNSLSSMPYSFTPISKTITKKPTLSFFGSASYNTFNIAGIGAGLFYHNIGIEYKYLYQTDTRDTGHEIGLKYKF